MKNFYLLLCAGIFSRSGASAQAYLGQSDKGKTAQAAAAIRLPFNADQVESALKAYLSQKGYSSSSTRGFILYRGVPLDNTDKDGSDLYFATSTPDRKVKDITVLSVIPSKKNQDIGGGSFVDSSKLDEARVFLDSLAPFVRTFGIGMQVNDQQGALLKAQKKVNDLRNDSTDYERRLRDLQSDLAQNKADQVKAAADLQTYIGADNDTKSKYQKRVNKLIDKQGGLEKKIRNTQQDLVDKKSDLSKQLVALDRLQQSLDATKVRLN
jgi:hypothetical protein